VFRLEPPPAPGSPAFVADLNELLMYSSSRTTAQADLARYWATGPPPLRWTLLLEDELERRGVSAVRSARAHAILSTTMHDAMLACWDSKYFYWYLRPITADPTLNLVVSTPPFPSYPSGHSTMSFAAYLAMAELFPDKAEAFHKYALDASMSRVYGGIHYRFDIVFGDSLGAKVGREAVRRARSDGSS
jgi:membrane-associated phospholipid phosphatase